MWTITRTAYKLVWRQSEFAFFVRWLRLAHFFILRRMYKMPKKTITHDIIADALINMHEAMNICDSDTATGFRTSKKKGLLKSTKEGSFGKFTQEIKKRQSKKDGEM